MKTYEGTMTIKWYKNHSGDCRPLTIDCKDKIELNKELKRITEAYKTLGDSPEYHLAKSCNIGTPAFSVNFDLSQRK
ncbi:MAG: hypothetical protein IPJ81_06560 [Chitinophagaceae bacterium]|nr:hypothetical protein [Chitinophagaceae bacterium]